MAHPSPRAKERNGETKVKEFGGGVGGGERNEVVSKRVERAVDATG